MNSSNLQQEHISERLKIIHISGICVMIIMFFLMFLLNRYTSVQTLFPQFLLLCMGIVLAISYLSILFFRSNHVPKTPIFFLFILNILTSALVWSTGTLQSPFTILYIILILITAQLYNYKIGIFQALVASIGFVFIYSATTYQLLPVYSLSPSTQTYLIYDRTIVVFIYGILYATLFVFTLLSSSSARVLLFRPSSKDEMDSTFQEQIVKTMPIGVLIVDADLNILGDNPTAALQFPRSGDSNQLTKYLSLPHLTPKKTLSHLAKTGDERQLTWKLDTGEIRPVSISVQLHKSLKKEDQSFILFLR